MLVRLIVKLLALSLVVTLLLPTLLRMVAALQS
jgi:hypothetical protein